MSSNLPVKIKKLSDKAVIPTYAIDGSAAMDLTATSERIFFEHGITYLEYGTGIAMSIPEGFVGLIFPRSSISSNTMLILSNSVGVIDPGYFGEIKFRFKPLLLTGSKKYNVGDRVGQIMIIPRPEIRFEEVDDLGTSERGIGGYGSSGK